MPVECFRGARAGRIPACIQAIDGPHEQVCSEREEWISVDGDVTEPVEKAQGFQGERTLERLLGAEDVPYFTEGHAGTDVDSSAKLQHLLDRE